MVLVQKWSLFQLLFFRQYRPGKCLLRYSRTKKTPSQAKKNKKFNKPKNLHFSKRVNPWFWPKMAIFPTFFFGKIGQENVFYDILERKNSFLGYKNKKFEKLQNCHFSTRVNPWFWPKMAIFPTSFFQAIQARRMCFTIFQNDKTPFQAIKNKKFKRSKNCLFSKGPFLQFLFLRQYRPGKYLLRYSRTKKRLSKKKIPQVY